MAEDMVFCEYIGKFTTKERFPILKYEEKELRNGKKYLVERTEKLGKWKNERLLGYSQAVDEGKGFWYLGDWVPIHKVTPEKTTYASWRDGLLVLNLVTVPEYKIRHGYCTVLLAGKGFVEGPLLPNGSVRGHFLTNKPFCSYSPVHYFV